MEETRCFFFALICDEYTNISNKEQLKLCFRWIDGCYSIYEDLLGFSGVSNIKSVAIVSNIRDVLLLTQISLDKCRVQCDDGASNMLHKNSGVAKQIFDIQPKPYDTYYNCHALGSAVKETTKESKASVRYDVLKSRNCSSC